ncbi:fibronectin type III domain-containing protein [Anaeropeptidivorans aminofermentans]|uniref:hypothetical protein n=1 Tax=Anaeropeptidivorans aminofermentans TaxID=2934315 RepID=UPI002ECFC7D6
MTWTDNNSKSDGTTYYYKIKTVTNRGGNEFYSDYSNYASATYMRMPEVKSLVNIGKVVSITWGSVAGALKYNVYRDSKLIGTTTSTSYSDTATLGTSYDYSIQAVAGTSLSTKSAVKSIRLLQTPTLTVSSNTIHHYVYHGLIIALTHLMGIFYIEQQVKTVLTAKYILPLTELNLIQIQG